MRRACSASSTRSLAPIRGQSPLASVGCGPLRSLYSGAGGSRAGVSAAWGRLSAARPPTSLAGVALHRQQLACRRLATESSGSTDASQASQKQKKEEERHEDEQKKEKKDNQEQQKQEEREEEQDHKQEEWDKDRETKGGYKQEVNAFQKVLAVLIPLTALGIGVKTLLDLRGQGMEDDTLQVDMNAVMSHVFQTTVYNVLDSKKLITHLGDPLLVEPTKAKFSFSKDFAWISYPLYGPQGHICTVTVDVLRIDPTKESVKLKKPHMWYVAQIEVDLANGKKVLVSTKMEGVKQPFNVIQLFSKIWADMKRQEEEYQRQMQAATDGAAAPKF